MVCLVGDAWLRNPDGDDFDARSPEVAVLLKSRLEVLVQCVKERDVNFLQGVTGAKPAVAQEIRERTSWRVEGSVLNALAVLPRPFGACTAERDPSNALVDFVVNLVEYPGLVVVHRVVPDRLVHHGGAKPVDNFHLVEVNHHAARSAARNATDGVSLHRDLNLLKLCDERHLDVEAGLGNFREQSPSLPVDAHIPLGDAGREATQDHWRETM